MAAWTRTWGKRLVLVALTFLWTWALLSAGQASADAVVPANFLHAVADRMTLLGDSTGLDPTQPTTFSELQSKVESFAVGSGNYDPSINYGYGWVVDPETALGWDMPTLLERASGESQWLGEHSTDAARERQISQVFQLLNWRAVADPNTRQPEGHFYWFTASDPAPSTTCTQVPGQNAWTPSEELRTLWTQEAQRALASQPTDYVSGGFIGVEGNVYPDQSVPTPSTVWVRREVWLDAMPSSSDPDRPIRNVSVNAIQLVGRALAQRNVGLQMPANDRFRLAVTFATRGSASYQPVIADSHLSGTPLGEGSAGTATGKPPQPTTIWNIPVAGLEKPGTASDPRFKPLALMRVEAVPEVSASWPPTQLGSACHAEYTNAGNYFTVIYEEHLPPLLASASITGTLVDYKGRPIPHARVDLLSTDVGTIHRAQTNSQGRYQFIGVKPESYNVEPRVPPEGQPTGGQLRTLTCPGKVNREGCRVKLKTNDQLQVNFRYQLAEIKAEALEVTQGIEPYVWQTPTKVEVPRDGVIQGGDYIGVPLAERVRTVVRLYAHEMGNPGALTLHAVPAQLRGFRIVNGRLEQLPESPIQPLDLDGAPTRFLTTKPELPDARTQARAEVYEFRLPVGWTTLGSRLVLEGQVDPAHDSGQRKIALCHGCGPEATVALRDIDFHRVNPIEITPMEIQYRFPGSNTVERGPDLTSQFESLRDVLPIRPDYLRIGDFPAAVLDMSSSIARLVQKYDLHDPNLADCMAPDGDCRRAYHDAALWLTSWAASAYSGYVIAFGPASTGVAGDGVGVVGPDNPPRPLTADAHELFHLLDFHHASSACGGGLAKNGGSFDPWPPDETGLIQGIGLDRAGPGTPYKLIYSQPGHEIFDFMSYCTTGADANSWISVRNWTRFVNGAGRADARDPVEADTVGRAASAKVEIGAAIAADGTAIVLGVKPTTAPASLPTRGPYTVAAEDGTGRELAHITAGTSAVADSGDQMLDVVLPVPTGTTKVVMSRGARVLATELRPAQVPRVHFVSPTRSTPLAVNKPVKVMWVVTGGARDRLTYEIDLSTDGGRDWRLLEYGTTAKSLTLPPGILDPSKRARLRVIANDGFDDVSAISKPLKIH